MVNSGPISRVWIWNNLCKEISKLSAIIEILYISINFY
jgi:hypothetical protein